ncbi:galactose-6-phosphate isomerase subunit LacB [Staphylococcus auricularis]|uniref:galactose-6-phosphate isomerase subunit LacB n=1 Tax=Staphylococcus auricularis TaxID=29379 RepID=UPI001F339B80|nr:galactose-6-phosphate isomerase subunit LacB [Staphylococcus auricularis]MCE5037730.1 galactose-6-phosphate isomerase subunit LacB [Staphylococcus auricularis]
MKIAIGCDHIVTDIKMNIVTYLKNLGHEVIDHGTYDFHRTHYPIYGTLAAQSVVNKEADYGIVLCGTGVGISVSANKVPGARVALVRDATSARLARTEYDCNVIAVGGKVTGYDLIINIIEMFLSTEYEATPEKDKLIEEMNNTLKAEDVHYDNDMFKSYLTKWDNGEYTD